MSSKLDFFNNKYFVKEVNCDQIVLVEVPKTFIRFYLQDSKSFNFKWLVSKCSLIYINL